MVLFDMSNARPSRVKLSLKLESFLKEEGVAGSAKSGQEDHFNVSRLEDLLQIESFRYLCQFNSERYLLGPRHAHANAVWTQQFARSLLLKCQHPLKNNPLKM